MRSFSTTLLATSLLALLAGCAGTTPIKNVALPPVTTIAGEITRLDENGFELTDGSGTIYVRARLADGKKLNVSMAETVTVFGNLQGGQDRIFDGYVIRKANGEQIIVTRPSPHIGFILQTSFD